MQREGNAGSTYGSYPCGGGDRDERRERSPGRNVQGNLPGWWRVTIVDGTMHNTEWLLRKIRDICRLPFHEINYHVDGNDTVFFVGDGSVAGALMDTSNRIKDRYGARIVLRARACYNPRIQNNNMTLDRHQLQQLNYCLVTRYQPDILKMDLSKFALDQICRNANIDPNITKPRFMNRVLENIHSLCRKLKILDLSNNRIWKLDNLTRLYENLPELDELILCDNDIRFTGELSKISNHKNLTKLWLGGNPVLGQFSANRREYISYVRDCLPNITMLDGEKLPAGPFGLEPSIPERKDVFSVSRKDIELAKDFVQKFFQYYDYQDYSTGRCSRERLLELYHQEAVFSLSSNSSIQSRINLSQIYLNRSHNLKIPDLSKRQRSSRILTKKMNIVAFLNELPKTNHWLDSFTLDLTSTTPHMLCFTMQGIFLEEIEEVPRGFSRTFICHRDSNTKLSIINEVLIVRNLTEKQVLLYENAKYNNVPTVLSVTINIPDESEEVPQPENTNTQPDLAAIFSKQLSLDGPSEDGDVQVMYTKEQEEVAATFSDESKMNRKFSILCLEAANWNYDQAAMKFLDLKNRGGIPGEAFNK